MYRLKNGKRENNEYSCEKSKNKRFILIILSIIMLLILLLFVGTTTLGRWLSQIDWLKEILNNIFEQFG